LPVLDREATDACARIERAAQLKRIRERAAEMAKNYTPSLSWLPEFEQRRPPLTKDQR
jgi:hypothetical protein